MFLLNLIAMGIHEHLTGFDWTHVMASSKGASLFFMLYFVALIAGDFRRAFGD